MILGQWFYRHEDAKKKDGGNTTTNMAFHSIRITLLYGFYSGFINAIIVDAIIGYLDSVLK